MTHIIDYITRPVDSNPQMKTNPSRSKSHGTQTKEHFNPNSYRKKELGCILGCTTDPRRGPGFHQGHISGGPGDLSRLSPGRRGGPRGVKGPDTSRNEGFRSRIGRLEKLIEGNGGSLTLYTE